MPLRLHERGGGVTAMPESSKGGTDNKPLSLSSVRTMVLSGMLTEIYEYRKREDTYITLQQLLLPVGRDDLTRGAPWRGLCDAHRVTMHCIDTSVRGR